jgi:hypothetical protein
MSEYHKNTETGHTIPFKKPPNYQRPTTNVVFTL